MQSRPYWLINMVIFYFFFVSRWTILDFLLIKTLISIFVVELLKQALTFSGPTCPKSISIHKRLGTPEQAGSSWTSPWQPKAGKEHQHEWHESEHGAPTAFWTLPKAQLPRVSKHSILTPKFPKTRESWKKVNPPQEQFLCNYGLLYYQIVYMARWELRKGNNEEHKSFLNKDSNIYIYNYMHILMIIYN